MEYLPNKDKTRCQHLQLPQLSLLQMPRHQNKNGNINSQDNVIPPEPSTLATVDSVKFYTAEAKDKNVKEDTNKPLT